MHAVHGTYSRRSKRANRSHERLSIEVRWLTGADMRPASGLPRQLPRLRSPLARAVVPIVAGLVFFALLFGVTWLIAVAISGDEEGIRIGDREFTVGRVDIVAQRIRERGPILYADLKGTEGARAIVIDHDPNAADTEGWHVYFAYPAAVGPACLVSVDRDSGGLVDCDGRAIAVNELAPGPPAAEAVVEHGDRPVVKVRFEAAQVTATSTTGGA
jgi:hypothetical protein